MSDDFHIAGERARQRFVGPPLCASWDLLSVHEKATAIYEELRQLDRERMTQPNERMRRTAPPRSEGSESVAA
jgi:hypothetical protein